MWKAADKDFSKLCVYLVTARQGLLPYMRKGLQLFFIISKLLSCQSFSHRQLVFDGVQKLPSLTLNHQLVLLVLRSLGLTCSDSFRFRNNFRWSLAHRPFLILVGLITLQIWFVCPEGKLAFVFTSAATRQLHVCFLL